MQLLADRPTPREIPAPRRFVDLARGMGIPANDAARQVMDLISSRAKLSACGSDTPVR
jgi:hypothetical protein